MLICSGLQVGLQMESMALEEFPLRWEPTEETERILFSLEGSIIPAAIMMVLLPQQIPMEFPG